MMPQKETSKICLIGECLATGGAEKAMALLSQYFESKGIEVHIVIVLDEVQYEYSGTLLNLGTLKNKSNGLSNKWMRFRKFKNYLKKHQFEYIVDFRIRVSFLQEFITQKFLYNCPTVYTVHSAMTHLYFPRFKWQSKLIYKNVFGIVAVSNYIQNKIEADYNLNNVHTLYNPIDYKKVQEKAKAEIQIQSPFIVAAGRMKDDVKQFDGLIKTFAKSELPKQNIALVILGDGVLKVQYQKLAEELKIEHLVHFMGQVENPFAYFQKALFFVLTSKNEGLPTVILESLACGKPVVSFDCISGPNEMITHLHNGILVENQNFEALKSAMNLLLEDEKLYQHFKSNATETIAKFSLEKIGSQWLDFLKINVN